jgi:hypothetical protein
MEVRAPAFVRGRVRVKPARVEAVNNQTSETGSVADKDRFSGWVEQELGRRTTEKHYGTIGARGGQWQSKQKPRYRLKPDNKFPKESDFEGNSRRSRIRNMIRKFSKQKRRKPFIVEGHPKMPYGVYQFGDGVAPNRDLWLIQDLKKVKQPKRVRWLSDAGKEYVRRVNIVVVWERATIKLFKNRRFG